MWISTFAIATWMSPTTLWIRVHSCDALKFRVRHRNYNHHRIEKNTRMHAFPEVIRTKHMAKETHEVANRDEMPWYKKHTPTIKLRRQHAARREGEDTTPSPRGITQANHRNKTLPTWTNDDEIDSQEVWMGELQARRRRPLLFLLPHEEEEEKLPPRRHHPHASAKILRPQASPSPCPFRG